MGKIQLRRMANASGHKHRHKYRIPPEQNTCHRKTKKHSHNCHVYLQHPSFIIGLCTPPSPAFEQKTSSPNLPLLPMLQQKPKRIYPNSTNDSRTPLKIQLIKILVSSLVVPVSSSSANGVVASLGSAVRAVAVVKCHCRCRSVAKEKAKSNQAKTNVSFPCRRHSRLPVQITTHRAPPPPPSPPHPPGPTP